MGKAKKLNPFIAKAWAQATEWRNTLLAAREADDPCGAFARAQYRRHAEIEWDIIHRLAFTYEKEEEKHSQ